MEITIILKSANGEKTEISRTLSPLDEKDIIGSVESGVSLVRQELLPLLSSKLVEQHQLRFKGEKNKEEKWK